MQISIPFTCILTKDLTVLPVKPDCHFTSGGRTSTSPVPPAGTVIAPPAMQPQELPPQPQPPQPEPHQSWSLQSQFGNKTATKAIDDAYNGPLFKMPELPGKVQYDPKQGPQPASSASQVPTLDDAIARCVGVTSDQATA